MIFFRCVPGGFIYSPETTKLRQHNRSRQERVVCGASLVVRSCCTPETGNPPVFENREEYRRESGSATSNSGEPQILAVSGRIIHSSVPTG